MKSDPGLWQAKNQFVLVLLLVLVIGQLEDEE
jgi:hypothetical protein